MVSVTITGRGSAIELLQQDTFSALVSICSPTENDLGGNGFPEGHERISRKLLLKFDDSITNYKREYESPLLNKTITIEDKAPDTAQVAQLITFVKGLDSNDKILVHCMMGQNRSPAVGLVINCALLGVGNEEVAWDKTLSGCRAVLLGPSEVVPQDPESIVPNRLVVVLGDELLGCGGKLVKALDSHLNKYHPKYLEHFKARYNDHPIATRYL